MTARLIRTPILQAIVAKDGMNGDALVMVFTGVKGQLWERVAEAPVPMFFPLCRIEEMSALYCDKCNYDTHICPGCGESLQHGVYVCTDCDDREKRCTGDCDDAFPATVDPECPVHGF